MSTKTREILEADIRFISLCPRGKNGFATLYKAETAMAHFDGITKAAADFDEKGQLVACVWAPNIADSDGDYASAEAVEKMAHSYMKNAAKVDMIHDCEELPKDAAFVAESFIIQKGDDRFANMTDYDGNPVDVDGGWGVVMQIDDPELRKAYREGEWAGVSMYGPAKVRVDAEKADRINKVIVTKNQRVLNALRSWFDKDGELEGVYLNAFTNYDRSELLTTVTAHLRTMLKMPEGAALIVAEKFADTALNTKQETEMTKEEIAALVTKAVEEAVKPLNEQIETLKTDNAALAAKAAVAAPAEPEPKPEPKAEVKVEKAEPEADGMTMEEAIAIAEKEGLVIEDVEPTDGEVEVDPAKMSDEELIAYAAETEIATLKEETDFSDPKAIREYVAKRAEILKKSGKASPTTPKRIVRRKRSNVTAPDATPNVDEDKIAKAIKSGQALAATINKQRGY